MNNDISEMGKRIRDLRQSRGLTQDQLADRLNISTVHLSKIEIGRRSCSVDVLIAFALFFKVSLDYLVFGKVHSDTKVVKADLLSIIDKLTLLETML